MAAWFICSNGVVLFLFMLATDFTLALTLVKFFFSEFVVGSSLLIIFIFIGSEIKSLVVKVLDLCQEAYSLLIGGVWSALCLK